MNISDQLSGNFLTADALRGKQNIRLTIAKTELRELGNGVKVVVSFEETDKELVLNKTRLRTLADAYGLETEVWVGQKILLGTAPVNFKGQLTKTITILPAEVAAPTAKSHEVNGQDDPFDEDIPF